MMLVKLKIEVMDSLLFYFPHFFAVLAVFTLIVLSIIDFKTWILPDWLNASLALLGVFFHISTNFQLLDQGEILIGSLMGGGMLYVIRFFGNRYYGQDTLGLGDVKLMAAGGVWLGIENIVLAMTIGAFAGLMHGIVVAVSRAVKEKSKPDIHRLMIPAGPGFCIGLFIMGLWQYFSYFFD